MEDPYETIEYRGFNINIHTDIDPLDPIDNHHWFGTMITWHRNYSLGHEQPKRDPDEFLQDLAINADQSLQDVILYWEELPHSKYAEKQIKTSIQRRIDKHYIILPLYLYDHSGITMRTSPFSCPWDSGQVGFIYVSNDKVKKEFNRKRMSKKLKQKAIDLMIGEVNTYDQYLTGEIFGYMIEPTDKNKSINCDDSCWGFYGYDHEKSGLLEMSKDAINCAIKSYKEECKQNHQRQMQMNQFMQSCWAF